MVTVDKGVEEGKSSTPRSRWGRGRALNSSRRPISKGVEGYNLCFGQGWERRRVGWDGGLEGASFKTLKSNQGAGKAPPHPAVVPRV